MNRSEYLIMAAKHSKGSAKHWFRYLNKDLSRYDTPLNADELDLICSKNLLTSFQQVTLKMAYSEGNQIRDYIYSLDKPAKRKYSSMGDIYEAIKPRS